jgi:tetratricopeptide (TPR) repeat protein
MVGTLLQDRYRLDATLGAGAMGAVYAGRDTLLDRAVAIKVLGDAAADDERRKRWLHEAQAAARLQHPHVVAVYDAGLADGAPYIVMELVEGVSLRQIGPMTLPQTIDVGIQICEALEHVHAHGIVHRDLKPENVLVARRGDAPDVKLADLGVALLARTTRITTEGAIIGTAAYLSPEQALGGDIDERTDLYALGVMLYEMVAGRLPFEGEDPLTVISQHLHAPVVPPRTFREEIPPALDAVIVRCLAKSPSDRPRAATEVREVLTSVSVLGETGGADATAPVSDRVVLLDQLARGRLIGRRTELAQLRELWQRALKSQGHMALISGEPGVGKTRLAREIIVFAQIHGATVLQGGCYEFEASTPYLPFVEALRHWVAAQTPDALRQALGGTAAELARLAPRIAEVLGPLPASAPLSPQEERLRLFDSVARLFQKIAADRGLLLFLDDLHWADHGTIAMLHYLLRNLRDERLLIVGAYREIELDRVHPLSAALVDWNRERLATRVSLGRLTLDDMSRMLAAMFGQVDVSQEFVEAMQRETEGNPFFAEEVVKALIEQGQIYREHGAWQRRDVHDLSIPQSVKAAIGRRLERLKPATVEMLQTAAALGKVFEFAELAAVATAGEDSLLDALDEASAAQLVRPDRGDAFAFTHDKIREVLHDELNPVRQRRLHQRIGESLERIYSSDLDAHIADLAFHFTESSVLHKGLAYSMAAAERSSRMYAHEEALRFYDSARECAEELESRDDLRKIYEAVGNLHVFRGEPHVAVANYERALAFASTPEQRAVLHAHIGAAYTQVGDARGLDHLHASLEGLDHAGLVLEKANTLANIGRYHHYRAEHAKAVEFLQQARAIAEPVDDPWVLAHIYAYLAGAYQHMARYTESLEWARRCIAYGERSGFPIAVAMGNEFVAEDCIPLGRLTEALEAAERDRSEGERIGSQDRITWAMFCRGWTLFFMGDLPAADEALADARARAQRIGEMRIQAFIASLQAQIAGDRGRREEALVIAEDAVTKGDETNQLVLRSFAYATMGYVLAQQGAFESAIDLCTRAFAPGVGTDNRVHRLAAETYFIEALRGAGRADDARRRLADYLDLCRDAGAEFHEGVALRIQGQLLADAGQSGEALASYDGAATILERIGARLQLGRALYHRGVLRCNQNDAARGRDDLTRARDLFSRCDAALDREAADAALADIA